MTGRDLRALFSTNDRGLTTAEAFTNRQQQWAAVASALGGHLAGPAVDVEDLEAPRTNVLCFHGIGGIGKTTLSRKIEAALASAEQRPAQWGAPAWPGNTKLVPIRIDLSRAAGADFERVLLTVRLALAGAVGRPLPAFDLALRRYWDHNHPGEPLEQYLRRTGLTGRFAQALPEHLQAAVGDVVSALELPGMVGATVSQITGSLVRALREHRQTVRALAGCARLADLLEAEPDVEALSYYPHLLAWELAQLPAKHRVVPVLLLDAFEEIGDRTHRDMERLLQRVVWLMPSAFFIITGRSRLQWADPALQGQLDYTGPAAWPGLADVSHSALDPTATGGPRRGRQILIGDFSPEDCDDYLVRRLSRDGQALIATELREVITARSHGLPLYLDLAAMRFLEIRRSGRTPDPDDFAHDFPALIARTVADLTPEERHVLRAVSLLDAFDIPLAARAAGLTHDAPALRLTERPLVEENPFGLWPYHLHALIRSTIRSADDRTDDRWSAQDWRRAAERALAALGEQWRTHTAPGRLLLVGCLRQGLALARDFQLDLGWLAEAAWAYVGDSVWEPLAPPARHDAPDAEVGTAAQALVELLSALARRQHEHRQRTADRLTAVLQTRLLPDDLTDMATYYLAKAHRDLGQADASRRGMQHVADGDGRLAPAARRGLAHLARIAGDFPTAHDAARTLGWKGRHHRVMGDLWWPHGAIDQALASYTAARDEAEEHGVAGERATSQAHLALAAAFADPTRADDEVALAQQLLDGLDLRATTLTTHIATLIRDAGTPNVDDRARTLRTEVEVAGVVALLATLELAICFHHAVLGDTEQLATGLERMRQVTTGGDYAYYSDIAHFMAGLPLPDGSQARWLDGEDVTRGRWHHLVTTRREQLRAQR
ncbi:ATP/GTP-binding protein [Streptomyces sp. NPDC059101]|uniref:ATP/GTP-binding protein n=1 Tax=Streptomyces sp. NPDC059101 TaxID=3346728 RepID=UPI003678A902